MVSNDIYKALDCQNGELTKKFIDIVLQDIILFDKKQSDRGPTNIAAFGTEGILIRCFDKMARLKTILWDKKEPRVSEPIENEWADVSVYGVIARLCMKGEWPGLQSDRSSYRTIESGYSDEQGKHNHFIDGNRYISCKGCQSNLDDLSGGFQHDHIVDGGFYGSCEGCQRNRPKLQDHFDEMRSESSLDSGA